MTRIAVIGAGPSGLYAVAALLDSPTPIHVDVFDRLPAPYGLVRYGVAPDHPKMKNVTRVLRRPFEGDRVRFFGNVRIGTDLTHVELLENYSAVIYATGMQIDRGLDIPGEERSGCVGAARFVNWYSGHPDVQTDYYTLDSTDIAVVGAGNVALDVARVLARSAEEMATTDVPDSVLDVLRASRIRDVHVLIRRAPQHVKFTPAELRVVGELDNADLLLHDHGFGSAPTGPEPQDKRARQVQDLLRGYAGNEPTGKPRRIHFRFLRSPVEILGTDRVQDVVLARNELDGDGRVVSTTDRETLEVGMVISAVGYRSAPLPGLPFDEASGGVPNVAGRVVTDGASMPGAYVTGWLKRGPTGVIGTNKGDAGETAQAVLDDLPMLPTPPNSDPDAVLRLLTERGVRFTDWAAWLRLDAEELRLGVGRACERIKVPDLDAMLAASHEVAGSRSG